MSTFPPMRDTAPPPPFAWQVMRPSPQILPTVFSLARGRISLCDIAGVYARKRSTMPRTNGRMPAEVTSTGASPSRAAVSNFSRTRVMNSDGSECRIAETCIGREIGHFGRQADFARLMQSCNRDCGQFRQLPHEIALARGARFGK
jgi:hypothetical protein